MVYKKTIIRNGKSYGPYFYENKRVGEKVVTKYIGKTKIDKGQKNYFLSYVLLILFLSAIAFIIFSNFYPTGKVALSIDNNYEKGEVIKGNLKLTLRQGELLPKDSKVIVSLSGQNKEVLLSDLIDSETVRGNFFVESINLNGGGEGYGIVGKEKVYPEVEFELSISNELGNKEEQQNQTKQEPVQKTEQNPELDKSQNTEEKSSSETGSTGSALPEENAANGKASSSTSQNNDESGNTGSASVENSEASQITGAVIEEKEFRVSGKASTEKDFLYNLEEGQSVSIAAGSVKYNDQEVGDDKARLSVENGKVIVSSDFSIEEEGFGEGFLGNEEVVLDINLTKFNINVTGNGIFRVSLFYEGITIVDLEKNIEVNEEAAGKEVNRSEIILPEVNETNFNDTIKILNETNATINITKESNLSINLTNESFVNITFSNVSIKTLRYKIKVGEPVRWVKNITLKENKEVTIELPKEAENITVRKMNKGKEDEALVKAQGITGNIVSGRISAEIEINKESGLLGFLRKIFSKLTGKVTWRAISGIDANEINQSSINITLVDNATNYLIEYYTEPALAFEEETSSGKKVIVSAPEQLNYTDVLVSSNLTKKLHISAASKIRVYWNNYEYSNRNIVLKDVDDVEDIEIVEEERYIDERSNIKNETQNETVEKTIINETEVIDNTGNESQIINESEIIDVDETRLGNESQLGEGNLITGKIISNISGEDISGEEIANEELLDETGENEEIESQNTLEDNEGRKYIKESLSFEIYDIDNDSYIDYIEWVAPHLSNQTFEIIEITKAEHLDSKRTFVEDIYDYVRSKEGNWTAPIPSGHYVRVVFEQNLTKDKDITIYARAGCAENSSVKINGVDISCEIYKKKLKLDALKRGET